MKPSRSRGFSLIELMIVIAVLSLLTIMAVTSYQGSVRKARRADAKADLMELAQLLERNYTEANSFATDISGNAVTLAYTQSPQQGSTVYYTLSFGAQTATTYSIVATPQGSQAKDTRCMNLSINEVGLKSISGSGTVAECW